MTKNNRGVDAQAKSKPSKDVFGRPPDNSMQTFFMTKLRNGKLQVINAQSEAELALHDFHDRNSLQSVMISKNERYKNRKVSLVRQWFNEIDPNKYEPLWQSFISGIDNYQILQINDQKDFPEYLFCDHCDLSYVLHQALHSQIPELRLKTQFSSDQLLFFELICFASRDVISFGVIDTFRKNHKHILNQMNSIKEAIIQHHKNTTGQWRCDLSLGFVEEDNETGEKGRHGQMKKSSERSNLIKQCKNKMITKKNKGTGRRSKSIQTQAVPSLLSTEEMDGVLHKLLTHIAWAYRYILPEEMKKKIQEQ